MVNAAAISEGEQSAAAIREVAERLKIAVRAAGGSKEVAEKSGVPLRTVNSYMAAEADPKMTKLSRIADACGWSLDQLMGSKLPVTVQEISHHGSQANAQAETGAFTVPEGFVPVPHLAVRASAGAGRASLLAETFASAHFLFSEAWLRSLGVAPQNAELLQAEGDSMYPTIQDGDLMLVDRGYGDVVHGKIYALVVRDLVVVKRVNFLAAGGLTLISDNDRYPSETIPRHEVNELGFQGRIAWYGRAM